MPCPQQGHGILFTSLLLVRVHNAGLTVVRRVHFFDEDGDVFFRGVRRLRDGVRHFFNQGTFLFDRAAWEHFNSYVWHNISSF